jgi:hypothetical protein
MIPTSDKLSDPVALPEDVLNGESPGEGRNMDAETQRMWELIGSLSDAFWRRLNQPGVGALDALCVDAYRPESDEEKAIWAEITAPHNYASLRRYIESKKRSDITDYAARLYDALLAEAAQRWETTMMCAPLAVGSNPQQPPG